MKSVALFALILAASAHAAKLDFDALNKDLKVPADVGKISSDFKFTNKTDKPVVITKYDAGCSCVTVQVSGGKLKYEPGEGGTIRATFDMENFSGSVDKTVSLWLDEDSADKPSISLITHVDIPVLVTIEPKTLKWELGGSAKPQTIRIEMKSDAPIHILEVAMQSEAFSNSLKTIEDGVKYELTVTPKDIGSPGLAVMRIETDCPIARHRVQQAFAVVRKPTAAETAAKQ